MSAPELLCPAGSAPAMVAAVQCGADAVYLGAGDFNARRSADNFGGELDAAVLYCHARGVRVYVTLNTMVRQDEMARLETTIGEICRAGADGVIVQDFGVVRAIRQMAPMLPLHASTQMAVHNRQGVEFLAKQGFHRVVLAREMRFDEIARCTGLGPELEVFVHGALCVSCSGQCLMSSMIGGRSGNRGLCAQPCRMKYRTGAREGYFLSTRDLCGLPELNAYVQAGVNSLKIEGRLKRPEYVAAATQAYRGALDALESKVPFDSARAEAELAQMFNRGGFTRGYGAGAEDCRIMFPSRPNHMGVEIGACTKNGEVVLSMPVDAKDVLALRRGNTDIPVNAVAATEKLSLREARTGDALIRLVSREQMQRMAESFAGEHRKFPVSMRLRLNTGAPATLEISDGAHIARVSGDAVQAALSRPIDAARVHGQLEKLGDTPFELLDYAAEIDANAFLPLSALNALRRRAVEALIEMRGGQAHACAAMSLPAPEPVSDTKPKLCAQSADPMQLRRALDAGAGRAAFAPEDIRPEALDAALALLPERFDLVLPPVASEADLRALNVWALKNEGRIARCYLSNIGQFDLRWPGEIAADMHLNLANALALAQIKDWGISLYTPSVELNRAQIDALGGRRELIVYGRLPLMQLRHCPLRAMQNLPGEHAACRRCDSCAPDARLNAMTLTDRTGATFPLRRVAAENGCVIRLMNSAVLMLLRRAGALPRAEGWRLLLEMDDPVEDVVHLHALYLSGNDPRRDPAWARIEKMNTTTGHYFRGVE